MIPQLEDRLKEKGLYEKFTRGDLVLVTRVEPRQGMELDEFDAAVLSDYGPTLLREVDVDQDELDLESMICVRPHRWELMKKKKLLCLDFLELRGLVRTFDS